MDFLKRVSRKLWKSKLGKKRYCGGRTHHTPDEDIHKMTEFVPRSSRQTRDRGKE